MKKILGPFFLILFLIILSIFISSCSHKEEKEKTQTKANWEDLAKKKYSYYREENTARYLAYKAKHQDLKDEDIITRVNIGLDYLYYENTKEAPMQNTPYTLVNKYFYLKEDFVPENLEELEEDYSKGGIYLVHQAKENFIKLVDAAKRENLTIRAISAYRGYTYQQNLYKRYVEQDGKEKADTYSARPGFSDHQTGLVVDVDNSVLSFDQFEQTEEFKWMEENAKEYGFILRYPKGKEEITGYQYESWHYRYVGVKIAKKIKESNLTFDEYYMRYLAS